MPKGKIVLLTFCLISGFSLNAGLMAESKVVVVKAANHRDPAFIVPVKLQARVKFWVDIFSKYTKNHAVIHHREFPQIIFKVLDFSAQAVVLGPIGLEKFRQRVEESEISGLLAASKHLANGGGPRDGIEQMIVEKMRAVPGGRDKYKKLLEPKMIRSQTGIREKYAEAVRLSGLYLPTIEKIFVNEYGLPVELTRLPFIESSFDYSAYSSVGAAGIWQFMRPTGRVYGLKISSLIDERRDPIASTRAAAQFLKDGYRMLGKWPLTLTGYNHGMSGVRKKARLMGTTDIALLIEHPQEKVFGFASSNFYPEFLAALEIYDHLDLYFPDVKPLPAVRYVEQYLPRSVAVRELEKLLDLSAAQLKEVNQALHESIWSGRQRIPAGYRLKVPVLAAARVSSLNQIKPAPETATSAIYSGGSYRVRKGDTVLSLAKKFNITVDELRAINGLSAKASLKIGQALITHPREEIHRAPSTVKSESESQSASVVKAKKFHIVKKGDTLSAIANRYRTSTKKLIVANQLQGKTTIKLGQKLVLP